MLSYFSMTNYIIPLIALVFNIAGFAFCLKFQFSRDWRYWILPTVMSLALITLTTICTINIILEQSDPAIESFLLSLLIILGAIGFFWIWSVLIISIGLKRSRNKIEPLDDGLANFKKKTKEPEDSLTFKHVSADDPNEGTYDGAVAGAYSGSDARFDAGSDADADDGADAGELHKE